MQGLYMDEDITAFANSLLMFATKVDLTQYEPKPFKKYVKQGYARSICYDFTIDEIAKVVAVAKLGYIRTEPMFTFRLAFTDDANASKALHSYDKNRITLIVRTKDYKDLRKDTIKYIKHEDALIGTFCHELTHAFDYSCNSKSELDINKHKVYLKAKKEMGIDKDYIFCNVPIDEMLGSAVSTMKFYYVMLYYTQQTEMNAYLQTFKHQLMGSNSGNTAIEDSKIYKRYRTMLTFLDTIDNGYEFTDDLIEMMKESSYHTCFQKVNNFLNSHEYSNDEKLKKLNFLLRKNYVGYEINRMWKIYNSIRDGVIVDGSLPTYEQYKATLSINTDEI